MLATLLPLMSEADKMTGNSLDLWALGSGYRFSSYGKFLYIKISRSIVFVQLIFIRKNFLTAGLEPKSFGSSKNMLIL